MFHQTFQPSDLLLVLALIVLEGLLSIDNALVLGLLARRLPQELQTKALTYGLAGSLLLRLIAVSFAAWLLQWRIIKLIGGAYLLYVATRYFFFNDKTTRRMNERKPNDTSGFWTIVASIELTDVAFAADSILAGIALVGPLPAGSIHHIHPKMWVVLLGGMLGVLMMRATAVGFIRLLKRFPRFELTAYLLVTVVALKLIADWCFNFTSNRLDFQSPSSAAFWVFWISMLACVGIGFLPAAKPGRD
jgi:YkoY family integral membrane protein